MSREADPKNDNDNEPDEPIFEIESCPHCGGASFLMTVTGHLQCRLCGWTSPEPAA